MVGKITENLVFYGQFCFVIGYHVMGKVIDTAETKHVNIEIFFTIFKMEINNIFICKRKYIHMYTSKRQVFSRLSSFKVMARVSNKIPLRAS